VPYPVTESVTALRRSIATARHLGRFGRTVEQLCVEGRILLIALPVAGTRHTGEQTENLSGAYVTLKPPSDEQFLTMASG
jgi:hypothetical protein